LLINKTVKLLNNFCNRALSDLTVMMYIRISRCVWFESIATFKRENIYGVFSIRKSNCYETFFIYFLRSYKIIEEPEFAV